MTISRPQGAISFETRKTTPQDPAHETPAKSCPFCVRTDGDIVGSVRVVSPDDGIAGSLMIMPLAHRETLRELTAEELADSVEATNIAWHRWYDQPQSSIRDQVHLGPYRRRTTSRGFRGDAAHRRRADTSDDTDRAGANLIWNLGPSAGQTVPHIHAHFVRRDGTDLLPGFGARWWLKKDLRGSLLLRLVASLNPQDRWQR